MFMEEIDLTYEGIATYKKLFIRVDILVEEIDLTYEGIATRGRCFLLLLLLS